MSNAALSVPIADVQRADADDLRAAIQRAEERTGFTFQELRQLAERDALPSLRTRSAWQAISVLESLAS
jgi:hypothetical protein